MSARPVQRGGEEGRRRTRPVVSARPVLVRDLQHRRQHRHQCRRAVLCEVRRHHRLCAGHGGGAGRWHRGPAGRPTAQGCRRAEPDKTLRRQRGHAGRHHGGDAAAAARTARVEHCGGHLRLRGVGGRRRAWGRRAASALDAGVHGFGRDQRRRGHPADGPGPRCGRHAGGRLRRTRPGRDRGRGTDGRGVRRKRCERSVFDRRSRTRARRS